MKREVDAIEDLSNASDLKFCSVKYMILCLGITEELFL